jgi:hypothetical protein
MEREHAETSLQRGVQGALAGKRAADSRANALASIIHELMAVGPRVLDSPERAGPSMLPVSRRLPQKLQVDLLTWSRLRPPLQACFDQAPHRLAAGDGMA